MASNKLSDSSPDIAIIGGGLAGLTLLLTLHRRGVLATLYEREVGFNARAHLGGTLDLGWTTGQRALRENGLQEEFDEKSRPEGEESKICDGSGKVLLAQGADEVPKDPTKARPEIDRSVLRKILLDAIPVELIKWGHGLTSVKPLGGGKHELTFSNGTTAVSDILVGADGANSRIRPLVSAANPLYTGINGAEISIAPTVAAREDLKDVREFVGKGSMFACENNRFFASQLNGDGRIRTYATFRGPEDWRLPQEPSEARKAVLEVFEAWAPIFHKIIEHSDDAAIYLRTLYYLPVGHRWEHVPGVSLIGDASHLMSPFAGAGANLAMLDGLEHGLAIADAVATGKTAEEREVAIAGAEEKMFAVAAKVAAIAKSNIEAFVSPDAPASTLERVKQWMAEGRDETK